MMGEYDEVSEESPDDEHLFAEEPQNNDPFAPAQGYIYPKDYETP